ncbi:hypothetical protein EVA_14025, partial [gut metagenome]
SFNGYPINADVNGCFNIGSKKLGDDWLKKARRNR